MKKILTLTIFLFSLVFIFSGCGNSANAPDGMKALESSDTLDYNLYIPEDWTQDLSTGVVSAYCGKDDMSNISMTTFTVDDTTKNLDDITNEYIEDLKTTLSGFELCEGFPMNITFGNIGARKFEYTANITGSDYKLMQITCGKNGKLYIFTYTSMAETYDNHSEEVASIIDNFEFR